MWTPGQPKLSASDIRVGREEGVCAAASRAPREAREAREAGEAGEEGVSATAHQLTSMVLAQVLMLVCSVSA